MKISSIGISGTGGGGGGGGTDISTITGMDANAKAWLINPTSANLAVALGATGVTGTGKFVEQDSPTITTQLTVQRDAIGSGVGVALYTTNTTAATNAAQVQNAPAVSQHGSAWDGTSSIMHSWRREVRTVAGAGVGTTSSSWVLGYNPNFGGGGVYTDSLAIAEGGAMTFTRSGGGSVVSQGFVLQNAAAAANGAQQRGAILSLIGQGWDTTASASKPVEFGLQVVPFQTAGDPTATLGVVFRTNNGAYSTPVSFSSAGTIATVGAIQSTGGIIERRADAIATTSTTGFWARNTTAATVGTQVQYSPNITAAGAAWNGTISEARSFIQELRPVAGSGSTTFTYVWGRGAGDVSGALDLMTLDNIGNLRTSSSIVSNANGIVATRANIATTTTAGFTSRNTQPATVGVPVQYSPSFYWSGTAYNTVSTLSETQDWKAEVRPISAAGATTSQWALSRSLNGASFADVVTISSSGTLTAGALNSTSTVFSSRTTIGTTNTDGFVASNTTPATVGIPIQYSQDIRQSGAGYNSTSGLSEPHDWRWTVRPTTAAGTTAATYALSRQVNGAGYGDALTITSGGTVTIPSGGQLTVSGALNSVRGNIATTSTDAFTASNPQAATVGTPVQYSPRFRWTSTAYNSTSTLSETRSVSQELRPASAAATSFQLAWIRDANDVAGAATLMTLSDTGALNAVSISMTGTIATFGGQISAQSGGTFLQRSNSIATTAADGFSFENTNAATVGVPIQYSARLRWRGSGWETTGSTSQARSVSAEIRPTTGATSGFNWVLYRDANDVSGATDLVTVSNTGTIFAYGQVAAASSFQVLRPIVTTSTDGVIIGNVQAATVGVPVQYSPRMRWTGTAWQTTTPVSEAHSVSAEMRPISGASTGFNWVLFRDATDVAGALDLLTVAQSGTLTSAGSMVTISGFQAIAGVAVNTTQLGLLLQNSGTATSGNQRYSKYAQFSGTGWGTTAGTSQQVDVRTYIVPIQGLTPSAELTFEFQLASGGFNPFFKVFSGGGFSMLVPSTAPATPPTGMVAMWYDTAAQAWKSKDSTGTVRTSSAFT